jgi:hypothetical protein
VRALIQQELDEQPSVARVDDLTDAEVQEVLDAFPDLVPVARHPRPSRLLLRRPYLVDLLARASDARRTGALVGEEDMINLVEDRLIRRDGAALPGRGTPAERMDVFLALADAAIAGQLPARLDRLDGAARDGLCLDDIIVRVRHSYRFAHDVLADLAITARLLEPDGREVLSTAPEPRRLLRAVRLWMQRHLADVADEARMVTRRFDECLGVSEALSASDGERWGSLPFEALLHAGPAARLLSALEPRLLSDEGRLLGRLLDATVRLGRPYPSEGNTPIDVTLSAPVVDLLGRVGSRLPLELRSVAARLVRLHLAQLGPEGLRDPALLANGRGLVDALVAWAGDASHGGIDDVLAGLTLAAPYVSPEAETLTLNRARRRAHDVGDIVEDPACAAALARHRPDLLLRLAGCYYINRELSEDPTKDVPAAGPRPRGPLAFLPGDEDDQDGVRNHTHRRSLALGPLVPEMRLRHRARKQRSSRLPDRAARLATRR